MSDLITINTDCLEEAIRCAMCDNHMKSKRGCDGSCQYDGKLLRRIMGAVIGCIEEARPQWILCSERLPDKDGCYIVSHLTFGKPGVVKSWFSTEYGFSYGTTYAWMSCGTVEKPYEKEG